MAVYSQTAANTGPNTGPYVNMATTALVMLALGPAPSDAAPSRFCGPISVTATVGTGDDDGADDAIGVIVHYTSGTGNGTTVEMLLGHGSAPGDMIVAQLNNVTGTPFSLTLTNPNAGTDPWTYQVVHFNGVAISAGGSTLGQRVTLQIGTEAQATVSCVTFPDPTENVGCLDSAFAEYTLNGTSGCHLCSRRQNCHAKCRPAEWRFDAYPTDRCAAANGLSNASQLGRNSTETCSWQGFYQENGQCRSCQTSRTRGAGSSTSRLATCQYACDPNHAEYAAYSDHACTGRLLLASTMTCYRSMFFLDNGQCVSCSHGGDCLAPCDRAAHGFDAYAEATCSDVSRVRLGCTADCFHCKYHEDNGQCVSCSVGGNTCTAACTPNGASFDAFDDDQCTVPSSQTLGPTVAPTTSTPATSTPTTTGPTTPPTTPPPTTPPVTVPPTTSTPTPKQITAAPTYEPTDEPTSTPTAGPTMGPTWFSDVPEPTVHTSEPTVRTSDASTAEEEGVTVMHVIAIATAAICVVVLIAYVYYKRQIEGRIQDPRFRRRTMTGPIWDAALVINYANDYSENAPPRSTTSTSTLGGGAASPIRDQGSLRMNPLWHEPGRVDSSSDPTDYRAGPAAGGKVFNRAVGYGFGAGGSRRDSATSMAEYAAIENEQVYAIVSDEDLGRTSYTHTGARMRSGSKENVYEYDSIVVNDWSSPGAELARVQAEHANSMKGVARNPGNNHAEYEYGAAFAALDDDGEMLYAEGSQAMKEDTIRRVSSYEFDDAVDSAQPVVFDGNPDEDDGGMIYGVATVVGESEETVAVDDSSEGFYAGAEGTFGHAEEEEDDDDDDLVYETPAVDPASARKSLQWHPPGAAAAPPGPPGADPGTLFRMMDMGEDI